MFLRRTNGFNPIGQLRDEVDRLFGDFFGQVPEAMRWGGTAGRAFPAVNIWERGDELYAEAEVPGLRSEDVDISVVGNELVIQGRRMDLDEEGVSYHRRERGVGEFKRVLRLPVEVDADKVEATLHDGVLLVKLPKAAAAKPRKIQVAASGQ
jgi:HSP20 family protein